LASFKETAGCLDKMVALNLARSRKDMLDVISHIVFSHTKLTNYLNCKRNIRSLKKTPPYIGKIS
jgi:hypothetical protein